MNWRSTRSLDFAPCAPVEKEDTGTFAECYSLHFEQRILNVRGGHWQWQWTLWKHLTHRGKWLDRVNIQLLYMSDLINVSDILYLTRNCSKHAWHGNLLPLWWHHWIRKNGRFLYSRHRSFGGGCPFPFLCFFSFETLQLIWIESLKGRLHNVHLRISLYVHFRLVNLSR